MFLGVSTILFDDGATAVMTDGFFSRPSLVRVGFGRIAPDKGRIDSCLGRAGIGRLDAVLPVHSHYDHALDSAAVAARTGAVLLGGGSTMQLATELPDGQRRAIAPGETERFGAWTLEVVESRHCPPDRFPGEVTAPVVPPARARAWRCGEAWSVLVHHDAGNRTLVQGSAGFVPGALDGRDCNDVWLGIGQLGIQPEQYVADYWRHTVRAVGARRVVLTHWDDFFKPLPASADDAPLRPLPYVADDVGRSIHLLREYAAMDGVQLHLPAAFDRMRIG